MKNLLMFLMLMLLMGACQTDQVDQASDYQFKEDKTIVGKSLHTFPNGVILELLDDIYILQGDIMLSDKQVDMITSNVPTQKSAVMSSFVNRWPYGIVYYTIERDFPSPYRVLDAIAQWEAKTPIRFIERTNQQDYVEFIRGEDPRFGSSHMGKIGGKQKIILGDYFWGGSIMHEIGHTVGLFHEQCRNDRDRYVNIYYKNIKQDYKHNFYTYNQQNILGTDIGPFDFNSIMLYDSYSFSINTDLPTMLKKDGSVIYPNRLYLSEWDIYGINYIYSKSFFEDGVCSIYGAQDTYSGAANCYGVHLPAPNLTCRWNVYNNDTDEMISFSQVDKSSLSEISVCFREMGVYSVTCYVYGLNEICVGIKSIEVLVNY